MTKSEKSRSADLLEKAVADINVFAVENTAGFGPEIQVCRVILKARGECKG